MSQSEALQELRRRAAARYAQLERRAEHDLGTFIPLTTPAYRRPDHLAPLLRLLDEAMRRPVLATVSVPPRHFKTDTLLHGVARMLRYHPERMNAYATYNGEFAARKSRKAREVAVRARVPLFKKKASNPFAPTNTVSYWTTSEGGGFLAVGRGGGFTGDGVTGMLVIDDPHKDRADAESSVEREGLWEWFTSVALTRIEETGSVVVTHTRWHEEDLIGRIRKTSGFEDWHHVNLPAIAMEGDALGRSPGEALCPWKFSAEELQKRRRRVGEYDWWSLFQGEPRPRGAKLFGEPHFYTKLPDTRLRFAYGIDLAYSASSKADYSVRVDIAVGKNELFEDVFYILGVDRQQLEAPAFGERLKAANRRRIAPFFWRAFGPERGTVDLLKGLLGVPIRQLSQRGDKFVHAQPVSALWNAGRVLLPANGAPDWLEPFVDELRAFTGVKDKNDDQVDALCNAVDGLTQGTVTYDGEFDRYLPGYRV